MPSQSLELKQRTILLAEADVIVRLGLAAHLRARAHSVLEAASAREARTILQSGARCHALLCDAQLAHDESGFALAQWTRRARPNLQIVLAATLNAKSLAVVQWCAGNPDDAAPDAAALNEQVRRMMAHRSRRARNAVVAPRASVKPIRP